MVKKALFFMFLPLMVLMQEVFAHFYIFGFDVNVFHIVVFSFLTGCALNTLLSFLSKKAGFVTGIVFFSVSGFLYSFYVIYYKFFHTFYSWSAVAMAGNLIQFWRESMHAIFENLLAVVFMYVPLVLFIAFGKKALAEKRKMESTVCTILLSLLFALIFSINKVDITLETTEAFKKYGLAFSGAWDVAVTAFGRETEEVMNPYIEAETESAQSAEIAEEVEYNTENVDFDYLLANAPNDTINDMHKYFSTVPPTKKNEYTSLFKGKNLIFLCLEGFCGQALDESLTPVLYKMFNEGFKFNNFYNSLWGGSTATGEYAVMTGNFYSKANCIKNSANTNQYYSLGNMFRREGYNTYAFHNHSYTYYDRHKSHPNFGYDLYKAVGNGLEVTKGLWPNSDEEMAINTIDDFINSDKPFHTYYMTVSGHAFYTWDGNHMSKRNREYVSCLPYSEGVKAYFACQYEVEKMLKVLLDKLTEAGKLENTVFAMCADHYPYALSDEELSELYNIEKENIRSNFELYKNLFILWTPNMESIEIDKPCSSYDIVPTIANLFGIEYDSRLITGKDILADGENIAVLNLLENGTSWNWITEKGYYDAYTDIFTPCVKMSEEDALSYKEITINKVKAMRNYSYKILDNDYYNYVFENEKSQ